MYSGGGPGYGPWATGGFNISDYPHTIADASLTFGSVPESVRKYPAYYRLKEPQIPNHPVMAFNSQGVPYGYDLKPEQMVSFGYMKASDFASLQTNSSSQPTKSAKSSDSTNSSKSTGTTGTGRSESSISRISPQLRGQIAKQAKEAKIKEWSNGKPESFDYLDVRNHIPIIRRAHFKDGVKYDDDYHTNQLIKHAVEDGFIDYEKSKALTDYLELLEPRDALETAIHFLDYKGTHKNNSSTPAVKYIGYNAFERPQGTIIQELMEIRNEGQRSAGLPINPTSSLSRAYSTFGSS